MSCRPIKLGLLLKFFIGIDPVIFIKGHLKVLQYIVFPLNLQFVKGLFLFRVFQRYFVMEITETEDACNLIS